MAPNPRLRSGSFWVQFPFLHRQSPAMALATPHAWTAAPFFDTYLLASATLSPLASLSSPADLTDRVPTYPPLCHPGRRSTANLSRRSPRIQHLQRISYLPSSSISYVCSDLGHLWNYRTKVSHPLLLLSARTLYDVSDKSSCTPGCESLPIGNQRPSGRSPPRLTAL